MKGGLIVCLGLRNVSAIYKSFLGMDQLYFMPYPLLGIVLRLMPHLVFGPIVSYFIGHYPGILPLSPVLGDFLFLFEIASSNSINRKVSQIRAISDFEFAWEKSDNSYH